MREKVAGLATIASHATFGEHQVYVDCAGVDHVGRVTVIGDKGRPAGKGHPVPKGGAETGRWWSSGSSRSNGSPRAGSRRTRSMTRSTTGLRLITCGGRFDSAGKSYTHNIIAYAYQTAIR